jgi:ribosomal-protein-serine acetyltransferase
MQSAHTFPERLDTARFSLRGYHASDAEAVLQLVARNRERLLRNFPELAQGVRASADVSAYMEASGRQWREAAAFTYGIWSPSEAALLGQLKIKNIVWKVPAAELSYFVDEACLRQGVATEAIRAVLREAFETRGFKRIYVRIIGANEESLALARRLDLRHEGVHRNAFRCGLGELHDVHLFAMTDGDHHSSSAAAPRPPDGQLRRLP